MVIRMSARLKKQPITCGEQAAGDPGIPRPKETQLRLFSVQIGLKLKTAVAPGRQQERCECLTPVVFQWEENAKTQEPIRVPSTELPSASFQMQLLLLHQVIIRCVSVRLLL